MNKIFKVSVLFFVFLFCITYVNAANINMNLQSNTINNELNENSAQNNLIENSLSENINENNVSNPRVTSTTTDSDDEFLTVENILSIVIIVIGILLVFLAVAILIRFK